MDSCKLSPLFGQRFFRLDDDMGYVQLRRAHIAAGFAADAAVYIKKLQTSKAPRLDHFVNVIGRQIFRTHLCATPAADTAEMVILKILMKSQDAPGGGRHHGARRGGDRGGRLR